MHVLADLNQATADLMESIKKFELVRERRKNRSREYAT